MDPIFYIMIAIKILIEALHLLVVLREDFLEEGTPSRLWNLNLEEEDCICYASLLG